MSRRTTRSNANLSCEDVPDLEQFSNDLGTEGKAIVLIMRKYFMQLEDKFNEILNKKTSEIEDLHGQVGFLRKEVSRLTDLVDESDAFERKNSLIISGESIPISQKGENCSNLVVDVLKDNLKLVVDMNEINSAYRLGKPPVGQQVDKRPIVVKLCRHDIKKSILQSSRNVFKNSNSSRRGILYINENLTPTRLAILKSLRDIKRKHGDVVKGCTSYDGRVYAFVKSPNPTERDLRKLVNTREQFSTFCTEYLKKPIQAFLANWPKN